MTHKPYPSMATHTSTVGALTHIDLWGKYDIKSPNKNQYYILFVDDYSRYVTVQFLKAKSDTSKHVRDYLTHMTTCQYFPLAILSCVMGFKTLESFKMQFIKRSWTYGL